MTRAAGTRSSAPPSTKTSESAPSSYPQEGQDGEIVFTELELDETAPIDAMSRYDANLLEQNLDPAPLAAPDPATTWQVELASGVAYEDVVVAFWYAGAAG